MSESKARLERENIELRKLLDKRINQLVDLINYVLEEQENHPEISWGDMPGGYEDYIWRLTNV